jgi:uncharacterized membrane protein YgdD (TMEM256/DUF423 family)
MQTALILVWAGLAGAAGVALAAAGAHGTQLSALTPPAQLLIMHAAAAVGIVAVALRVGHPAPFLVAAVVLLLGATLFSVAVSTRVLWDFRLFPMAAPTGGTAMIAGWLVLAVAGVWELVNRA